jgi:hypothetical protein
VRFDPIEHSHLIPERTFRGLKIDLKVLVSFDSPLFVITYLC